MKQQCWWQGNRRQLIEFDAVAIRRSDPVVANLEAIRSTDGRFEQRFIYESPIITIEPNGDDQVLQARPPAFVEVEAVVAMTSWDSLVEAAPMLAVGWPG